MTDMRSNLRFLTCIALISGTALLAACGGPDKVTKTTTTEQTTTSAPMEPATSTTTTTTSTQQTRPSSNQRTQYLARHCVELGVVPVERRHAVSTFRACQANCPPAML